MNQYNELLSTYYDININDYNQSELDIERITNLFEELQFNYDELDGYIVPLIFDDKLNVKWLSLELVNDYDSTDTIDGIDILDYVGNIEELEINTEELFFDKISNLTTLKSLIFTNPYYNRNSNLYYNCDSNSNIDCINTKDISKLTNLNTLKFEGISISKIECGLGLLTNLNTLIFENNKYIEYLPNNIGNLINLETLIISHNPLKTLPDNIVNCTNLTTLELLYTKITKLPHNMDKLIKLKNLIISPQI